MEKFNKFVSDETASAKNLPVVNIAISLILVATLGVSAFNLLGNANYSYNYTTGVGFDPTTKLLVQTVIGVVTAVVIILIILKYAK